MAATAAYIAIVRVPMDSQAGEAVKFDNISASTAAFRLYGGRYAITCKASTYGTVTFQIQAEDGSTMLTVLPAFSADGTALVDLPPGLYKFALA